MQKTLRLQRTLGTFLLLITLVLSMQSQTTNISGIINIYTPVLQIDTTVCPPQITVANSAGFLSGDKVLIIQMRGANYDTSNTSSFGNLINLNGAGSYEIANATIITGNVITLNGKLSNLYNLNGNVQLVRIPTYTNALVTSALTCQPWNGTTGGVLILNVLNNLTLNANVHVSGKGFRGGTISKNPDGSCGSGSNRYHYPLYQPGMGNWIEGGAQKGEGIGDIDTLRIAGRGPLVNGGGGGNKHNTGGGGGSNYSSGGKGGDGLVGCAAITSGIGGNALGVYYSNNKLFAGGGGGCGDQNNFVGSAGANGGGIAIIIAGSLTGNSYSINANGDNVTVVGGGIADGAGGGGGGGSVFLKTNLITGTVNISANGGKGGDQSPTWGCVGPGGGGGTGAILTSMSSLSNISPSLLPGNAGIVFNTSFTCNNTSYGAVSGSPNSTGVLIGSNLPFIKDSTTCNPTITFIADKNNLNNTNITIYPNPANSAIFWNNEENKTASVKIYDCFGRIIYTSAEKTEEGKNFFSVNIQSFPNGLYLIEVTNENKTRKGRFVKN